MKQRDDPLTMFRDALSNPVTRDRYEKRLGQFFEFMNLKGDSIQSKVQEGKESDRSELQKMLESLAKKESCC